jgi:hypothetical protein
MRDYVAVAPDDIGKAYHGTAVVNRDEPGRCQVDTKATHPGAPLINVP